MPADHRSVKVRPLRQRCSNQQSSVAAAEDRQLGRICVLLIHQPFGCSNEIVEDVLLFGEHPGLMPGFAEFTAATQVDLGGYAAMFGPYDRIGPELGRDVNGEPAVSR